MSKPLSLELTRDLRVSARLRRVCDCICGFNPHLFFASAAVVVRVDARAFYPGVWGCPARGWAVSMRC